MQNSSENNESIGGNNAMLAAVRLAEKVIEVLDKKCRNGCTGDNHTWIGFQNGHGAECGVDIERLIKQAKRLLSNSRQLTDLHATNPIHTQPKIKLPT